VRQPCYYQLLIVWGTTTLTLLKLILQILIKDLNIYNSMGISESKYKAAETLDLRKLILDNSIELNDESAIDELKKNWEC
jgi:hypothetical protein